VKALYRSLHGESAKIQWGLIVGSSLLAGAFNVIHAQVDLISQIMAAMPSLFLLLSFETFLGQVKHAVKRSNTIASIEHLNADFEQKYSVLQTKLDRMRSTLRRRFEQERSKLKTDLERAQSDLDAKRSKIQDLDKQLQHKRSIVVELEAHLAELKRSNEAASNVHYDVLNTVNAKKLSDKQVALNALLNFYRSNPHATFAEAGEAIGRSKGTVSNYLNELEQAGLIHRNNGQGIEVP